jgi:hypothetical protein
MIVGLLTATVITLSHVYKAPHQQAEKKTATEQTESDKTVITAPTEAVIHGAVQVDEQVPQTLLEVLPEPQVATGFVPQTKKLVSSFLRTLFRVIISPNAP